MALAPPPRGRAWFAGLISGQNPVAHRVAQAVEEPAAARDMPPALRMMPFGLVRK